MLKTANESNTAKRLRKAPWLYVVFDCATPSPPLNILSAPSTLDGHSIEDTNTDLPELE